MEGASFFLLRNRTGWSVDFSVDNLFSKDSCPFEEVKKKVRQGELFVVSFEFKHPAGTRTLLKYESGD
jgi:hypothetical protein